MKGRWLKGVHKKALALGMVLWAILLMPMAGTTSAAGEVSFTIKANVLAYGAPLTAGLFQFELLKLADGFPVIQTVSNAEDGLITFNVTTALPDTINPVMPNMFYIREVVPRPSGWVLNPNETLRVMVYYTEHGTVASIKYPDGQEFSHYYTAPVSVELNVETQAVGAALPDDYFEFGLFDEDGDLVATVKNDAVGNVDFSPLAIGSDGVHNYTIRELTPSGGRWITDTKVFSVQIIATYNGSSGAFDVDTVYPDGPPIFVNEYRPPKPIGGGGANAETADESPTPSPSGSPLPTQSPDFLMPVPQTGIEDGAALWLALAIIGLLGSAYLFRWLRGLRRA
ncbi:MAG: hypothetical protein LBD02_06485 [Christensenellaceae bacterium]|jgi:hypothetical protein|nr:hypothetical protein [Christensenellaceae bacterium]